MSCSALQLTDLASLQHRRDCECREEGAVQGERRADAEEGDDQADLNVANRPEADGEHPGTHRAAAQLVRDGGLDQSLGQHVGEDGEAADEAQGDNREGQRVAVAEDHDRKPEEQQDDEEHPASRRRLTPQREADDAGDAANRSSSREQAEALGTGIEDVAGETRERCLIRKAEDFDCSRETDDGRKRAVAPQLDDIVTRALQDRRPGERGSLARLPGCQHDERLRGRGSG